MAGDTRLAIANDLLADVRPQPIRADQERAGDAIAGGEMRGYRRAVLIVAHDFGADTQVDQIAVAARFEENAVQIAAMHHRIGIAETSPKGLAEIDMADFLCGHRVHQAKLIDINRHVARGLADSEIVEGVKRVRPELNTGTDLAQRRCLLKQDRADAFLGQSHRHGEAADAAARDQNWLCARSRHQLAFPKCSSASSARSGTREASLLRSTSCSSSVSSVLRSAGLSGCKIRACTRSTDGMMSRSRFMPALVRYKSLTRLSSGAGLRST